MENKKQTEWSDVKKVKFHHKVKRFYHKNTFRKGYTMIIVGLLLVNIFSLFNYKTFANSYVYTNGEENNNAWGGGEDTAENGYDSGNPRSERQGPCPYGWHVPSRGEWQDIAKARCHYRSDCDDSDLTNVDSYGNLDYITKNGLGTAFKSSFGMPDDRYWSSSPHPGDDGSAWYLFVYHATINPNFNYNRNTNYRVRCLKNTFDDVNGYGGSSAASLNTSSEGYVITDGGKSYTLALNDLNGYYYRGVNENTDNTTWVDPNEGDGNGYGYGNGGNEYESCTITVNGNEEYLEYGETYGDGVSLYTEQHSCTASAVRCATEGADLGSWYTNCEWGDGNGYGYGYGYGSTPEPCSIIVDGSSESVEYGSTYSNAVYSNESDNCYKQYVSCWTQGSSLGSWYTHCRDGWNTATLEINADGDYELTYDGTTYTIASGNLNGTYQRGINTPFVSHNGTKHDNDWGGGGDTVANGYDSGNPRSERQGPCEDGWHVPSRGERADIVIARCNQTYNSCNPFSDLSNVDGSGNLKDFISGRKSLLRNEFSNSFGMVTGTNFNYWSSSPRLDTNGNYYAYSLGGSYYGLDTISGRGSTYHVRCLSNSIGDVSNISDLGLTINGDGDYELIYSGKKYTIAGSDLGHYNRGDNQLLKFGIENNNAWGGGEDTVANGYDSGNPRSERQGPCEDGWHVPSRGEWNSIVTAWCHLDTNLCTSNDLNHANDWTESNNLIYLAASYNYNNAFWLDFGLNLSQILYWSSSPRLDNDSSAWGLHSTNGSIKPNSYISRGANSVRCLKDSIADGGNGYGYGGEEPETDALIIPTTENYEVNVGGNTYEDELPSSMTVTTNNEVEVDEPVLGEVSVNFGGNSNATFTELMQIKIPVEGATRAVVKVKHAGSEKYNFDGLTKNRSASCNENGRVVDDADKYVGETIRVVDGFVSIYTCEASSFIAVGEGPISSQIILEVEKGELTIGTETGTLDLGKVRVGNNAQELLGEFGANSFWVEDMKGVESGYYTTISVTDLSGNVSTHVIPANSVSLKTENGIPSYITGASVSESLVVFGNNITSWYNTWTAPVTYFSRVNTPSNLAGRIGKWGDNLQVKVTIPAHTPSDVYKGTITYTLYDLDMEN